MSEEFEFDYDYVGEDGEKINPGPHITYGEAICQKCGIIHAKVHPDIVHIFEGLRSELKDQPILVTSLSRCLKRQETLAVAHASESGRVARVSPHLPWYYSVEEDDEPELYHGAIDILIPVGQEPQALASRILAFAKSDVRVGWQKYMEMKRRFIHFDVAHKACTFRCDVDGSTNSITPEAKKKLRDDDRYNEDDDTYSVDGFLFEDVDFEDNIMKPAQWAKGITW